MLAAKRGDFERTASRFGVDKVLARLIRNRDVISDEEIRRYLFGTLQDLYAPELMKDLKKAAELLRQAIFEGRKIRIIGDYDIDGIMSTYILMHALIRAGADADYAIPDRMKDGYGVNNALIREAFSDGRELILTCDNGIAAYEQAELAKQLGMTMIITDHHNIPYEETEQEKRYIIPPADAVVDPKQEDCRYPFPELCGAAVAWKVVCVLFDLMGYPEDEAYGYLQFAAIATIGDVVDLKDENRILVKEGLKQLHETNHIGLNALLEKCGIEKKTVDAYHIGFVIGPCLNASGRLDTADRAIRLMLTDDRAEALVMAEELCELNNMRKTMTEAQVERAVELIDQSDLKNDKVLVVYLPKCHESIAGIIAGRLREKYNRPAFVLTDSRDGVKGSGRSTEQYSMYDELVKVKKYLTKFGGHPMAAGVSMEEGMQETFRAELNRECTLTPKDLEKVVHLDMQLPIGYITESLIQQFEYLKPFGKGNEKPLFADKDLRIRSVSLIGKNRNVLKLKLSDPRGITMDGVCFHDVQELYEQVKNRNTVTVSYYPTINEFRGIKTIQIVIQDFMI